MRRGGLADRRSTRGAGVCCRLASPPVQTRERHETSPRLRRLRGAGAFLRSPRGPLAGSAIRVAGGLDSTPLRPGGFAADAPPDRRRKLDRLFRHARAIQGADLAPGPA